MRLAKQGESCNGVAQPEPRSLREAVGIGARDQKSPKIPRPFALEEDRQAREGEFTTIRVNGSNTAALGINADGLIVGAFLPDDHDHGFLAIPR